MESAEISHSATSTREDERPLDQKWTMDRLNDLTENTFSEKTKRSFIDTMNARRIPFDEYIKCENGKDWRGKDGLKIYATSRAVTTEFLSERQKKEFPGAKELSMTSLERDELGEVRKISLLPIGDSFDPSKIIIHSESFHLNEKNFSPKQLAEKKIYTEFLRRSMDDDHLDFYLQQRDGDWYNITGGASEKLELSTELREAANVLKKKSNEETIEIPRKGEQGFLYTYQNTAASQFKRREFFVSERDAQDEGRTTLSALKTMIDAISQYRDESRETKKKKGKGKEIFVEEQPLPEISDTSSEQSENTVKADDGHREQMKASEAFIGPLSTSDIAMQQLLLEQANLNIHASSRSGALLARNDSASKPEQSSSGLADGLAPMRKRTTESAAELESQRKAMGLRELELGQQAGDRWPAFIDSPKMSPSEKIKEMEKALDGKSSAIPPVSRELLECAVFRLKHPRSRETSPAKSGRSGSPFGRGGLL